MTKQETNKILALVLEAYPKFMDGRNPEITSTLWASLFEDEPYDWVQKGLMAFIASDTKGFAPTPGAIKEKIAMLLGNESMTEMEAWNLVLKAISNGFYGADVEFRKLPREVQEIVGSPSQLREWSQCDVSEVNTVIASNFQRSYRARAESRRMNGLLPAKLKINLPKGENGKLGQGIVGIAESSDEDYQAIDAPNSLGDILRGCVQVSND